MKTVDSSGQALNAALLELLQGVPLEEELARLDSLMEAIQTRHQAIDRSVPELPPDVGDGSSTEIFVLLELRLQSAVASVQLEAINAKRQMQERLATLQRIKDQRRDLSAEYLPLFLRASKIRHLAAQMKADELAFNRYLRSLD